MKPNVLYIFADQLSDLALRRNGAVNPVRTPNIDAITAKGVRFERSYCVTPQCSPARSSILTGLYPHRTGVIGNEGMPGTDDLDPSVPNLGNLLQQHGYHTAYFGKWHLGRAPIKEYGFDVTGTFRENDGETAEQALAFLDRQASQKTGLGCASFPLTIPTIFIMWIMTSGREKNWIPEGSGCRKASPTICRASRKPNACFGMKIRASL